MVTKVYSPWIIIIIYYIPYKKINYGVITNSHPNASNPLPPEEINNISPPPEGE